MGTNSARWSQTWAGGLYQDDSRIEPGEKINAVCPACREIGRVVV